MSANSMDGGLPAGTGDSQSPASPAQSPQGSPASEPTIADVLRELTDVKSQVRALQGNKDKGIAKVAKRLDGFEERLAEFNELKAQGLSDKVAMKLMRLDNLSEQDSVAENEPAAVVDKGGNLNHNPNVDTDALLRASGIEPNDPEVTQLYRQGKTTLPDIARFIVDRKARAEAQPNPAQVLPGGGGQSLSSGNELAELTEQLERLQRNPSQNMAEIRKLSERQRALLSR